MTSDICRSIISTVVVTAFSLELVASTFAPWSLLFESSRFHLVSEHGEMLLGFTCEKLDKLAEAWESVTLFFHFYDWIRVRVRVSQSGSLEAFSGVLQVILFETWQPHSSEGNQRVLEVPHCLWSLSWAMHQAYLWRSWRWGLPYLSSRILHAAW